MKINLYKESILIFESQDYETAIKRLITLKKNLNVNQDPELYLKTCQLLVSCATILGYQDLLIENFEEFYLISSFKNEDSELLFSLEQKLASLYIHDMNLE
jgi:hypothetical protein